MSTSAGRRASSTRSSVLNPPMIQLGSTAYEQARAKANAQPTKAPRARRNGPKPGDLQDQQAGGLEAAARMARNAGDTERADRFQTEAAQLRTNAEEARTRAQATAGPKRSGGSATKATAAQSKQANKQENKTASPRSRSKKSAEETVLQHTPTPEELYTTVYRQHQPVVLMGRDGETRTLVPRPSGSPDIVSFQLYKANGEADGKQVDMPRFRFEMALRSVVPAAPGSPHYTPPKPAPVSPVVRMIEAGSRMGKTHAQTLAKEAVRQFPYLRVRSIEAKGAPGSKRQYYSVVLHDTEANRTFTVSAWRDVMDHDLLRAHFSPLFGSTLRPLQEI